MPIRDDDHPIVRETVRAHSILPVWLWLALGGVALAIAVVAF